ncbi:MAG: serine hydrolase [Desulfobulbaceae bacterium]|nr:MAG: serine hydrolase [Desulfobulbaceae bacterium]
MDRLPILHENIRILLERAMAEGVFPGCAVAIGQGADSLFENAGVGNRQDGRPVTADTFFDLASLSKALATTLVILALIKEEKIRLNDYLADLVDQRLTDDKRAITLFHLLNHCAGLAAHRSFYTILEELEPQERPAEMLRLVLSEPLVARPGSRDIYSDLGFIILGSLIERCSGLTLEEAVRHYVLAPLGLADRLLYNPRRRGIKDIAAGQLCPWRQRVLVGEVDDQNTWIMGGVSGQAGLFGRATDVFYMVRQLSKIAAGEEKHPYLDADLLRSAMTRQGLVSASSWGLGFDTPSAGASSAGRFISPHSFGHLGFTGTSFWHDFDRDITVVLLTNRIHPSVENNKIKAFRPAFHDLVFQSLA